METVSPTLLNRRRPPFAYRAGLALVVVAMAVLPVIYVALTALAGWWVYYFATHYFGEIWAWPIGHSRYGLLFQALCSITPLVVGAAIVKPLFAPATELFENFDTISRLVTLAHYEDDLNVPTSPDFLIPLEKLIRAQEQPAAAPAPLPVPMMRYDPNAFRKPE